jgi:glycosyltransferase involved in cell wall biosynthesis
MIGKPLPEVLLSYISENNLQEQVVTLSGLSNEDLRAAYSMATGLLFPSLQEGFGWPILEAQACGCAVFATNKPPMTEVGGEAAIYFDPKDVEASADVVVAALERLDTVRKSGRSNVSRFGVEQMMAGYTDAYSNVVKARGIGQSACR